VGVCAERLLEDYPRGVVRGARAMVEKLAAYADLQLLALTSSRFERNGIVFDTLDLRDWLAKNPLDSRPPPDAVPLSVRVKDVLRRLRIGWMGALIAPLWKRRGNLKRALVGIAQLIGINNPIRAAYQRLRGRPRQAPAAAETKQCVAFGSLDAILSFEVFESVWEWPAELYRTRMIAIYHDAIPFRIDEGAGWDPARYFKLCGRMVRRAHRICCNSESTRRDLETMFPHARAATIVTPHGHDLERFRQAGPADRSWIHQKYSCRGRIVAMIGVIEPRKNQAGMFHACRYLDIKEVGERLTLLLIGRRMHPPDRKLQESAAAHVDIVETGYVSDEDLPKLLAASDVFVYPSCWEGFGLPVLEAMTAGVPVVCSDLSSLPEVGGEHVTYCDPYEPASIASAIREVLAFTPEERSRRIAAARQWAAGFTWEQTARGIHESIVHAVESAPDDAANRTPLRRAV